MPPGAANTAAAGEVVDEFGNRFKYKCPFAACEKNTGRRVLTMGFKEFAIHAAVKHHLIERLMREAGPEFEELVADGPT